MTVGGLGRIAGLSHHDGERPHENAAGRAVGGWPALAGRLVIGRPKQTDRPPTGPDTKVLHRARERSLRAEEQQQDNEEEAVQGDLHRRCLDPQLGSPVDAQRNRARCSCL